ncbi:MAG: hypothetical protein ACI8UR_002175 [Natronomonas sp.]|uniref:hypothetical protein n=1 Tax=Natronomonas sp. TaxID=2184060 RepID=UPI0039897DED
MNRRAFLSSVGLLATVSLSGCSADEFDTVEDVAIQVDNTTNSPVSVDLTVERSGSVTLEETVAVDADETEYANPRIPEAGEYELRAAVDDERTTTRTVSVTSSDVQVGRNIAVIISETDVRVLKEEIADSAGAGAF